MPSASRVRHRRLDRRAGAQRIEVARWRAPTPRRRCAWRRAGQRARRAQAQMPEPRPIGTNTTSGCTARKNSMPVASPRRAPGRGGTRARSAGRRSRGQSRRVFARGLEVVAVLDQRRRRARASPRSSRPSCRAARRWWRCRPWRRAAKATDWPWLPRVALITPASAGSRSHQALQVDQAAAQLEGAQRRVVLVLDPDLGAERARAAAARRIAAWRHRRVDDALRGVEFAGAKVACMAVSDDDSVTRPRGVSSCALQRRAGRVVAATPRAMPARWPPREAGRATSAARSCTRDGAIARHGMALAPLDQRRQRAAEQQPSVVAHRDAPAQHALRRLARRGQRATGVDAVLAQRRQRRVDVVDRARPRAPAAARRCTGPALSRPNQRARPGGGACGSIAMISK